MNAHPALSRLRSRLPSGSKAATARGILAVLRQHPMPSRPIAGLRSLTERPLRDHLALNIRLAECADEERAEILRAERSRQCAWAASAMTTVPASMIAVADEHDGGTPMTGGYYGETIAKRETPAAHAILRRFDDRLRPLVTQRTAKALREFPQSVRDDRRAAHDPAFARKLRRIRSAETRTRAVATHIAERHHHTVERCYISAESEWTWGSSTTENKSWPYKGAAKKYCRINTNPAVCITGDSIQIVTYKQKTITLPLPPPNLIRHAALSEPCPVGYFAAPVKGRPGVFACFALGDTSKKEYWCGRTGRWVKSLREVCPSSVRPVSIRPRREWLVVGYSVAGHRVPECMASGNVTLADISTEPNTETQRILIEHYGYDRYLAGIGAQPVQQDEYGRLYELPGGAKLARLLNSTANPDGSINEYYLPVPARMTTAHEAVAWSFGCTVEQYRPFIQS